ncbi:MAG TPA: hypothetical protein VIM14_19695, partial [Polyangia bacterium]
MDEHGLVWCPVSVNTDALKLKDISGTSFWAFLLHLYFPEGEEVGLPMSLSAVAANVLAFPANDWLKSEFEHYAQARYLEVYKKDPSKCYPDELAFFEIYGQGGMDGQHLLGALGTFDYFRISPQNVDSYIYVPTSAPRTNTSQRVGIPRSGASGATHKVNRADVPHFFYLDVGAWSAPQHVPGQGSAAFGMISADEIALWDLMAPVTGEHRVPAGSGTMVADFLNGGGRTLPGDLVFYARFFGDHFEMHRKGGVQRYHYRVPIPFAGDSMMFFIPDLHLHMFPHSAADNFLEPWPGGQSLATYLLTLFDQIGIYSRRHPVEVYQVGDCYELWESALLLCFAEGQDFSDFFTAIGATLSISQVLVQEYRDDLRREIATRKLDQIFTHHDVAKLGSVKWDAPSLRPVWTKMQEAIQRVQVVSESSIGKWRNRGLFTERGHLNADLVWTIVGGNHDSFVTDVTPIRRGVNDAVFIEHGHLRDDKNAPETILTGVGLTGLSAVAELKGVGDEIKSFEKSRRKVFQDNAAGVNLDPNYRYRRSATSGPGYYPIVVNGHTHRKYVALLREHPALPKVPETVSVFHEDPWLTRPWHFLNSMSDLRAIGRMLDNVVASS